MSGFTLAALCFVNFHFINAGKKLAASNNENNLRSEQNTDEIKQQSNVTIIRAYKARTISGQSINGPIHREHSLFPLQQQQAH